MKIIAIEGIDGSGKTYQLRKIEKFLQLKQISYKTLDFPNYQNLVGKCIGRLLSGEMEIDATKLDPRSMALWFAADRKVTFESFNENQGETLPTVLLLNRYTLSNAVYQVLRAPKKEREEIFNWILELEHVGFKLPVPDLYLIFDADPKVAGKNILNKGKREYLGDETQDVYEKNSSLLISAREFYLKGSKKIPNCRVITVSENKKMRDPEAIFSELKNHMNQLFEDISQGESYF